MSEPIGLFSLTKQTVGFSNDFELGKKDYECITFT